MTLSIISLKENPVIRLKTLSRIIKSISTKSSAEWDNGYTDYNERWIDQPAWSEHINESYRDYSAPDHSDHAKTHKG